MSNTAMLYTLGSVTKRFSYDSIFLITGSASYLLLPRPKSFMYPAPILLVLQIIFLMILWDFLKQPIDLLYFQKPLRPFVGLLNTLTDILMYRDRYRIEDYPNLEILHKNFFRIKEEFQKVSKVSKKTFCHEYDPFLPKSSEYYSYDCKDFPYTWSLLKQIPSANLENARFNVIDGEYSLPSHKGDTNVALVYNMTVEGDPDSYLEIFDGTRYPYIENVPGVLYDHSLKHSVTKNGIKRRTILFLNINRWK